MAGFSDLLTSAAAAYAGQGSGQSGGGGAGVYSASVSNNASSEAGGISGGFNFAPVKGVDTTKLMYIGGALVALFLISKMLGKK